MCHPMHHLQPCRKRKHKCVFDVTPRCLAADKDGEQSEMARNLPDKRTSSSARRSTRRTSRAGSLRRRVTRGLTSTSEHLVQALSLVERFTATVIKEMAWG